jgi:hypothetical protein
MEILKKKTTAARDTEQLSVAWALSRGRGFQGLKRMEKSFCFLFKRKIFRYAMKMG